MCIWENQTVYLREKCKNHKRSIERKERIKASLMNWENEEGKEEKDRKSHKEMLWFSSEFKYIKRWKNYSCELNFFLLCTRHNLNRWNFYVHLLIHFNSFFSLKISHSNTFHQPIDRYRCRPQRDTIKLSIAIACLVLVWGDFEKFLP